MKGQFAMPALCSRWSQKGADDRANSGKQDACHITHENSDRRRNTKKAANVIHTAAEPKKTRKKHDVLQRLLFRTQVIWIAGHEERDTWREGGDLTRKANMQERMMGWERGVQTR